MRPARFDRLYTVRLAHESRNGCAEVCREPDGALRIRLRMQSAPLQREVLKGLDASIPVRLEGEVTTKARPRPLFTISSCSLSLIAPAFS